MDIVEALEASLAGREVDEDLGYLSAGELVESAGSRPALARELVGLPAAGKLPARGTPERTAYAAALRRVQRWTTSGAQRRRPAVSTLRALTRSREERRLAQLARRGARVRLRAKVKVDTPTARRGKIERERQRTMPSGGPGTYLDADEMGTIAAFWEAGDHATAAGLLFDAFAEAYGFPDLTIVPGGVEAWDIWPDGEAEP